MELREIKREVERLPDIRKNVAGLRDSWFRHVKGSAVSEYKVFANLPADVKKQVGVRVALIENCLQGMDASSVIHDKLRAHARCLVDLKLMQFKGDKVATRRLTGSLLKDEFLSVPQVLKDIQSFEKHVQKFGEVYHEVNELMQKQLSLEETLFLMDLPHRLYFYNLIKTSQKQKAIVRDLGRHFVEITKENSLRSVAHK